MSHMSIYGVENNTRYFTGDGLKENVVMQQYAAAYRQLGHVPESLTLNVDNDAAGTKFATELIERRQQSVTENGKTIGIPGLRSGVPDERFGKDWNDVLKQMNGDFDHDKMVCFEANHAERHAEYTEEMNNSTLVEDAEGSKKDGSSATNPEKSKGGMLATDFMRGMGVDVVSEPSRLSVTSGSVEQAHKTSEPSHVSALHGMNDEDLSKLADDIMEIHNNSPEVKAAIANAEKILNKHGISLDDEDISVDKTAENQSSKKKTADKYMDEHVHVTVITDSPKEQQIRQQRIQAARQRSLEM